MYVERMYSCWPFSQQFAEYPHALLPTIDTIPANRR
jgi:hypothetical protein